MTSTAHGWRRLAATSVLAFGLAACSQDGSTPLQPSDDGGLGLSSSQSVEAQLMRMLDDANAAFAGQDAPYRVGMIEAMSGNPDEAGITVFWKDVGSKRLGHDFVPGDPRRMVGSEEGGWSADPNRLTYAIDPFDGMTQNGVSQETTDGEIRAAMATWDAVQCSDLGLEEIASPVPLGLIAFLLSQGAAGSPFVLADVQHAGWQEIEFEGGTVAATFTLFWVDEDGNLTDIDGDGQIDAALREIYYDDECEAPACGPATVPWIWEVENGVNDPGIDIDIQSIALHEAGHGLSQGHFGTGFVTTSNNVLHLTSNSVMAAAYVFPRTDLQGTDIGGHCANWGSWPIN